jgi:trk system potassium uptake protein TrkA
MFIIVAGCGRLGSRLSRNLSEEGHNVVVVAKQDELKRLDKGFDGVALAGIPIDEELLKRAGIEKADALVAVTADDNVNVMVAQIAKEIYAVPFVLARISDPEREEFYQHLGLTTVCPTNTGINQIVRLLRDNHATDLKGYLDSNVITLKPALDWVGKTVSAVDELKNLQWVGMIRHQKVLPAEPKMSIQPYDTLIFINQ